MFARLFPPGLGGTLRATLFTLLLGAAGGFILNAVGMPAGWLCGAMLAVAVAALRGMPTVVPAPLRDTIFVVLGTSMGSALTPATLAQLKLWPASIVVLLVSVVVSMYAGAFYLQRFYGWDKATARLSAVPGALSAVLAIASGTRAHMPAVAISQSLRQLVLVSLVPVALLIGPHAPMRPYTPLTASLVDALIMLVAGVAGAALLTRLRIPGSKLLGAMVASGALHAAGWVSGRLDPALMSIAYVVTGAVIGARLAGTSLAELRTYVRPAIGSVLAAICVAVVFATVCHHLLGLNFAEIWLAYAPGGVEAMTIMAFALNLDPSFVSTHHVIRLFFLMITSPLWTMGALSADNSPRATPRDS